MTAYTVESVVSDESLLIIAELLHVTVKLLLITVKSLPISVESLFLTGDHSLVRYISL